MHVPIEIYQCVSNYLRLKNILKIFRIDNYVYNNLRVKKIIDEHENLNNNIISQKKYLYLKELNAVNSQITDINHLVNLKTLSCYNYFSLTKDDYCKITNDGIKNLTKIKKLFMGWNKKLTSIDHLINLTILDISGTNVTNDKIKSLTNVEKLNASLNDNITYIGHMTKLKKLYCAHTKITNDSVKNMRDLEILECNNYVCDINHLTKLKKLMCSGYKNKIKNENVSNLTNLTYLACSGAKYITNVNSLQKLEYLECERNSGICDDGIKNLKNLKILKIMGNTKITNVNHLSKLEKLDCRGTMISDNGIKGLVNLRELEVSDHITTIKSLRNLTHIAYNYSNHKIDYSELRKVGYHRNTQHDL